jgi:BA14K-like protein
MRLKHRLLAAATALAIAATPFAASAESLNNARSWGGTGTPYHPGGSWGHTGGPGYGYHPGYHPGPYPRGYYYGNNWNHDNNGAAVAAGIAGLAVGAIVGSAAANSSGPTYYSSGAPQPWSPAWYQYCQNKYRSFDPGSGTFLGYDGQRHFCA